MTRKTQAGMTLVELVIAMLVIGILASIAIPSYRDYVIRSNRTEAKTALLATAAALERCYTRYLQYDSENCAAWTGLPVGVPSGNYIIDRTGDSTATTFTLTATPQGQQTADTGCGTLSLTDKNTKDVSGEREATECWSH